MILLNTKSILDCNEEETEVHFKEIEDLFETLSYDDDFCIVKVSYLDPIQIIDKCSYYKSVRFRENLYYR